MADLARIKRNVAKMAAQNAPEADIDGYIASEGVTIDAVRDFRAPRVDQATNQPPGVPEFQPQQPAGQPPSWGQVAGDVAAAAPSALARGTADLIGLPGSIGDLAQSGLQAGLSGGYRLATGAWPDARSDSGVERFFAGPTPEIEASLIGGGKMPLSGDMLRSGLSTATGGLSDYHPTTTAGEYTRTVGEFLPSALATGGGSLLEKGIRYGVVPALTSETAGQLTEGTAMEPWARMGGALLGGWAGSRFANPAAPKAPSAADIKKSAGYGDDMTDMLRGARTTDQTYQNVVRDLWADVQQAGTSHKVQEEFGRTLQKELNMVKKEGASLHSLERLRRALRDAGGGALDTPNQAIANRLIEKLDTAVDGLSASNMAQTATAGRPVLDVLTDARETYHIGSKSQVIEKAIRDGMDAKSGVENGLRQEFTRLLKNDKTMRGFTQAEQDAIRLAAKGNFTSLAARWMGTFGVPVDQGRNFLGSIMGGGVGSAVGSALGVGGPFGAVALPALGTAAKYGASQMAQNHAALAEAIVKAGPRGQSALTAAQQAQQVASKERILRALLQGQTAVQVPFAREPVR